MGRFLWTQCIGHMFVKSSGFNTEHKPECQIKMDEPPNCSIQHKTVQNCSSQPAHRNSIIYETETVLGEICLRFVDLVSELREFGDGQTTVFVAVEALDEVQSSVLRVMQFVAQDRHRFVERDISFAAETTPRRLNECITISSESPYTTIALQWTPLLFTFRNLLSSIDMWKLSVEKQRFMFIRHGVKIHVF